MLFKLDICNGSVEIKIYKKKDVVCCLKLADGSEMVAVTKLNKVDEAVVSTLKNAGKGLTLKEIAANCGETEKKVFRSLRRLFENEMIDCENHQYRLLNP